MQYANKFSMALIVSKSAQKKSVLFKSSFGRDLFSLIPCEISNLPFDPAVSQIKGVKVSQKRPTPNLVTFFLILRGICMLFFSLNPLQKFLSIWCQQMCSCADVSNIQGGQNMTNTQILNFYFKSGFDCFFFTFRLLLKCPDCIFSKIFDQTAFVIKGVKGRFENLQFLHISEGDFAKK